MIVRQFTKLVIQWLSLLLRHNRCNLLSPNFGRTPVDYKIGGHMQKIMSYVSTRRGQFEATSD